MLSRIGFALLCLSVAAIISWFQVGAFRLGRISYGHIRGRTLYADRDKNPRLFWLAFLPRLLFCIGLVDLAIAGPTVFLR